MAAEKKNGSPLQVIIVGAGIGGLTAAVGLREQGHKVTIFERSQLAQEVGAAIHLAPNCHGILRRLGVFPESFGANPLNGIVEYDYLGTLRKDIDLTEALKIWQHPWVLSHRVQLHNELKRVATSETGKGSPAVLKTSSRVTDVDTATGTITLEDGSTFSGDLIIGADGVSSVARTAIVGDKVKPFGSGKSAFRFLVPREKVLENEATKAFASRDGRMIMWFGEDRRLVMYPCSNNTTMNFVAIHPSEISASKGEGWDRGGSKEALLDIYREFGPTVKTLLGMVDSSSLKLWTLLDMEQLPTWTKGKLALVGDAAHPFLPHQGQGGGIAIEDAASICALFPAGTPKEEVPDRLALYEKIRMGRAHKIQEFTRLAGSDLDDERRKDFNIMEFTKYNFSHDEWHNTTQQLKRWLWSRNGSPYYRQPISFGPMTSPRQDHYGRRIPSHDARFTTHSIRFKTSTTYLQTLFPSPAFSFAYPGTNAEATFLCTELDNLTWLGGGGYNFFGLWIHGVQYTKKDGSTLSGSFLPILFESLSDPITTGREELGMPKLFADIKVVRGENSSRIVCSWRGATFVDMELGGQEKAIETAVNGSSSQANGTPGASQGMKTGPTPSAQHQQGPPDEGLFAYRYVPAVGKKGVADAEYAVFISKDKTTTPQVVDRTIPARAADSRIDIRGRDWESLPTLHHVAAGLAEVPIYEILEAKTVEGHGVEDLSQAERIE